MHDFRTKVVVLCVREPTGFLGLWAVGLLPFTMYPYLSLVCAVCCTFGSPMRAVAPFPVRSKGFFFSALPISVKALLQEHRSRQCITRTDSTPMYNILILSFLFFQDLDSSSSSGPGRRMDRLRRSLRSSLRKNKHKHSQQQQSEEAPAATSSSSSRPKSSKSSSSSTSKPHEWQADEVAVRSGTCCFNVKVKKENQYIQCF